MSKYIVIGYGSRPRVRNPNPSELPHGQDGIVSESDIIEKEFDNIDDAREYLADQAVSYGEEGGNFSGTILSKPSLQIVNRTDEDPKKKEYRIAFWWARNKLQKEGMLED